MSEHVTLPEDVTVDSRLDSMWCEFSARPVNALKNAGIVTVQQLIDRSSEELLRIDCFGRKSLLEVQQGLALHGFMLRGGHAPRPASAELLDELRDLRTQVGALNGKVYKLFDKVSDAEKQLRAQLSDDLNGMRKRQDLVATQQREDRGAASVTLRTLEYRIQRLEELAGVRGPGGIPLPYVKEIPN